MQQGIRFFLASITLATGLGTATAQPGGYEVIDLGSFAGGATDTTRAAALNDLGQVTGSATTAANRAPHAFFYSGGVLSDLGTVRPDDTVGAYFSFGAGINNAGQVVGRADNGNSKFVTFIAEGASPMTDIATLGGAGLIRAAGINDAGQIVGSGNLGGSKVVTWSAATGITELTDLSPGASATAINASGQVTGGAAFPPTNEQHAFLTGPNGIGATDLGTLGGSGSRGQALNSIGQVTGSSYTSGDAFRHAFFYSGSGGMTDLGSLGGSFSEGLGVNDSGTVVGWSYTAGDVQQHAIVSGVNGVGLFDLNWFVSLDAGRFLTEAVGINRYGQIVANDSAGHAFLLSPVPEPQTWAMVLVALALIGGKTGGLRRRGTLAAQRKPNLRPKG